MSTEPSLDKMPPEGDLTGLAPASGQAAATALETLFTSLYSELSDLARSRLRRMPHVTLLDTTSLVHESFLRCVKAERVPLADRGRFLAYASRVMRSVVVDYLRQRKTERHGGEVVRVTLNTEIGESVCAPEDRLIRISEALDEIAAADPRLVQVVEMRFFAGLTEAEIAASLGVTERTVRRDWRKARLLLSIALR
ncbi:MAG TPA: ECF-type sigma factor [Burkholderiaceae bacterium]|jgi:RNA polymerase sigma factor (TIGR02999 family)|nr:ECF-type sigma factor [Burkholderiaceae bacterium]